MAINDFTYKNNNTIVTGLKNKALSKIVIPEGVIEIDKAAFSDEYLTKVTFPSTLKKINPYAFCFCDALRELVFSDFSSLEVISESAFSNCYSLKVLKLPYGVKQIGYNAFYSCDDLKEVYIPSSVDVMKANVFEDCKSLKEIKLGHQVIPNTFHMLWNEDNKKVILNVKQPSKETITITNNVDREKPIIKEIKESKPVVKKEVKSTPVSHKVNTDGYTYTPLDDLKLEKNENGKYSIIGLNKEIETLVVPLGVDTIAYNSLSGNKSITTLIGHDGLAFIGSRAFDFCNLKRIKLSKNTFIAPYAFTYCQQLENAYVNSKTANAAYSTCGNIQEFFFESDVENIPYELFFASAFTHVVTIPDHIKQIGSKAFWNCTCLKTLNLGKGLKEIQYEAFEHCQSLEELILPENLERIAENAFFDCRALKKLVLNKNLFSIGNFAFCGSKHIEKVTFPPSVKYVGKGSFYIDSLKEVIIERYQGEALELPLGWSKEFVKKGVKITFKHVKR